MKYIITTILLFGIHTLFAQNYIVKFDNYKNVTDYKWRGIADNDFKLKNEFADYCIENGILINEFRVIEMYNENTWNYLTTVDLNNDEVLDIVYNGPSGGEANNIYFFIKKDNDFHEVFFVKNGIAKVEWKGELLSCVYTYDNQCCGGEELFNTVYEVVYNSKNVPEFNIVYQSTESQNHLRKPKTYFEKPIKFKIQNSDYKLRFAPEIDDSTNYNISNSKGNTVAFLDKEMNGTAYASKVDKTGRIWWYVEMMPNSAIRSDLLSNEYNSQSNHIIGWLSSRFIVKTDE